MIVKQRAAQAGVTVGASDRLSAHCLRASFITIAYGAGTRDEDIASHTRHKTIATMRGYVRRARLVTESPAKKLGCDRARPSSKPVDYRRWAVTLDEVEGVAAERWGMGVVEREGVAGSCAACLTLKGWVEDTDKTRSQGHLG